MKEGFRIQLQSFDLACGRFRTYRIGVGTDLPGGWLADVTVAMSTHQGGLYHRYYIIN